jgi:cutinase
VSARQIASFLGAAVATTWAAVMSAPIDIPSASAGPCPDVEVVFARGTTEPSGTGAVGQAFVDSLRPQVARRSVGVYAVNYPATDDYSESASTGANDASAHIRYMAASCPNTKMMLGGYSQGAIVIDLITAVPVPVGFTPAPMPAEVAEHVAAVAVFGNPWGRYVGAPLTAISPLYGAKAIDLCAPADPICSQGGNMLSVPRRDELFSEAHLSYVQSGMVNQAAAFAASRL